MGLALAANARRMRWTEPPRDSSRRSGKLGGVTAAVNQEFGRMDVMWSGKEPGWYRPLPTGPANDAPYSCTKAAPKVAAARVPADLSIWEEHRKGGVDGVAVRTMPIMDNHRRKGKGSGRGAGVRRRLTL